MSLYVHVAQIAEHSGVHEGTTHVWCQIAIDTPRQAGDAAAVLTG